MPGRRRAADGGIGLFWRAEKTCRLRLGAAPTRPEQARSLLERNAEGGGGSGAVPKAYVFAQFTETQRKSLDSPASWRRVIRGCAIQSGLASAPRGRLRGDRVGIREVTYAMREQHPGWRRPGPNSPLAPSRLHGMPPAHECFGGRHYPCGSRLDNKEERRRKNAGSKPASQQRPLTSIANGRH